MSEPIGPGDWVECIDAGMNPLWSFDPNIVGPPLMQGALYLVERVGVGRIGGEELLWLRGVTPSVDGGYCLWRFRPIRDGQERIVKKERVSA